MTSDENAPAMQRYHDRFDSTKYNTVAEFLTSNLNAERGDLRVIDGMLLLQEAALEL